MDVIVTLFCSASCWISFLPDPSAAGNRELCQALSHGAKYADGIVFNSDCICAARRGCLCKRIFHQIFKAVHYENQPNGIYSEKDVTGVRRRTSAVLYCRVSRVFALLSVAIPVRVSG